MMKKSFFQGGLLSLAAAVVLVTVLGSGDINQ